MTARIRFRGPARYRLLSAATLSKSVIEVAARRALKGPRLPGWNFYVEAATEVVKRQTSTAFRLAQDNVAHARAYLDATVINSPELSQTLITPVQYELFRGSWFVAGDSEPRVTVLYFHGGGYSFYPLAYANFIALITRAARSRTFALDYRLTPEHRFPAQLEDALNAYRWLLELGTDPNQLILAGDSAGGNLALAVLLAARESKLPLPALVIALSPPTDFEAEFLYSDAGRSSSFDWIDKPMLELWADWFCDRDERRNPFVSPSRADLRNLPHIYLQAGRAEILYPSIQAFADRAHEQGADVILESWEDMPHDFQIFGLDSPPSAEALRRIAAVVDVRVRGQKHRESVRA